MHNLYQSLPSRIRLVGFLSVIIGYINIIWCCIGCCDSSWWCCWHLVAIGEERVSLTMAMASHRWLGALAGSLEVTTMPRTTWSIVGLSQTWGRARIDAKIVSSEIWITYDRIDRYSIQEIFKNLCNANEDNMISYYGKVCPWKMSHWSTARVQVPLLPQRSVSHVFPKFSICVCVCVRVEVLRCPVSMFPVPPCQGIPSFVTISQHYW